MSRPQPRLLEIRDPLSTPGAQRLKRRLRRVEWIASAVNGVSFVALLTLTLVFLSRTPFAPLWTDFGGVVQARGQFPLAVTVLAFPLITSLFHAAQALDAYDFYQYGLVLGYTPHRWLEYAITNGLITFDIFLLAGAGSVPLLLSALVLNALMNFCGYLHERANSARQESLGYLFLGFLPWLPLWLVPLVYYAESASRSPTYYGTAILGSFVISLLFPLPLVWRYYTSTERARANYYTKVMYAVLSFTSKLYLGWVVVLGAALTRAV